MATGTLPSHSFYTYSHLVRPLLLGNRWYIVPCLPICIIVQIRIILMSGLRPLGTGTPSPSSHYTYLFIHTIHIHIILLSGPLILGNRYPVPLFILYNVILYFCQAPDMREQVPCPPIHIAHIHIILLSNSCISYYTFANPWPVGTATISPCSYYIHSILESGHWHKGTGTLSPNSYHAYIFYIPYYILS